jgi:hypothetical protein
VIRTAALLLALGHACAAHSADTPGTAALAPFKAEYAATRNGRALGTGELHLQQLADGRWSYGLRLTVRGWYRLALGSTQKSLSVFRIIDGRVMPESFISDEDDQRIAFNWTAGRVTGAVGRRKFDLPAQPGLLDTLSVQVAMMQELLAYRRPARFALVDEGRIKEYAYSAEGSEVITSPAGTFHTEIFSSRRPGSKKATYFWSAPALGYIPLKVERRDGYDVEWSMSLQQVTR